MISLLLFILLLTVSASVNKSLPKCLSDCYYIIGHWFTLIMVLMAFSMLQPMIDASEDYQPLAFLTCAGIIFVGVAAEYKDDFTFPVHRYSAIVSAVCGVAWTSLVHPISLLWLAIGVLGAIDYKHGLFWLETACFVCVYGAIIFS